MSDTILVNGNQLSWGSIIVKFNGDRYYGFTGITYSDKLERVHAYGMGKAHAPRGRSRGKYTVDPVKLTGWTESVQILRKALADRSPSGTSYGDVEVEILVQYVENGKSITVELHRCVWASSTNTNDEGPDPLKEEVEFNCMRILRNGLAIYDDSEVRS